MKAAPIFSSKTKLCSCLQYRSVVLIVVGLSIMHILMGVVSICLGTISSIKGKIWMAHKVSPIWSGAVFIVTGVIGLLSLRYQTSYIMLCYTASTLVSFVCAIVGIQLSRLGIVNHTTDGQTFRKDKMDTLLLVTLGISSFECLVCFGGCFVSCRLSTLVKLRMLDESEGPFIVEIYGDKDVEIIPHKKLQKYRNTEGSTASSVNRLGNVSRPHSMLDTQIIVNEAAEEISLVDA